jgi:hypothetical protein
MEPTQRIEALFHDTLEPRIAALESLRTSVKRYITKSALCVGLPFAAVKFGDTVANALGLSSTAAAVLGMASVGLLIVGAAWAVVKYLLPGMTAHADYKSRFKREIATEVFRIVCPTATYSPTAGLARHDFDEAGLFTTQGSFSSDDRVHGTIGQTPFEAAEVRRTYSTGGKNSRLVMVFHGLFFHIDFNKSLRGVTLVQPESAPSDRIGSREGLQPVMLENPAFAKAFAAISAAAPRRRGYCSDGTIVIGVEAAESVSTRSWSPARTCPSMMSQAVVISPPMYTCAGSIALMSAPSPMPR